MLRILEFLTGFYWILIPQFIIESLYRVRWREALESRNPITVVGKGLEGALGLNSAVFYVELGGSWNRRRLKRLLTSYDIPMWGWGFAFDQLYFHVPAEDADMAHEIMWRAGVDLLY